MLLYTLSMFCPSCQTSAYPDIARVGVPQSSSPHFLGAGLSYVLDINKPVSLQLF